jgi:hypothetical protein
MNRNTITPIVGLAVVQILKYVRLSIIYELIIACAISFPYLKKSTREIGVQTDSETSDTEMETERDHTWMLVIFPLFLIILLYNKWNTIL